MNTKNVINLVKPTFFTSFHISRKIIYLDIHDDIGTLYQMNTESSTLSYIKFNLSTGEEIQLPLSTNSRIVKNPLSTYNNQIIKFNNELLYVNSGHIYNNYIRNSMYKITNNEVTQFNYGPISVDYITVRCISMDYIFVLNGDLTICSKNRDINGFTIYNFRTKETVEFKIPHEVIIKNDDITYFSTSTKLYLHVKRLITSTKDQFHDGIIYEIDLTNLEVSINEIFRNITIKKLSENEFIYTKREYCLLHIYNLKIQQMNPIL